MKKNDIKITLGDLVESQPALQKLANSRMSPQLAFLVGRAIRFINPELQAFTEQREGLIRQYGSIKNDASWEVGDDCVQEFRVALQSLLGVFVDLDLRPIPSDMLAGNEGLGLFTPGEMATLYYLFD